jgi:hypothetical protein
MMKSFSVIARTKPSSTSIIDSENSMTAVPYFSILLIILLDALMPIAVHFFNKRVVASTYLFRHIWGLSFLLNLISVSIPGRFDGQVKGPSEFRWNTLFAPAGWTFSIWGVIYSSEILLTLFICVFGKVPEAFRKVAIFWAAGNIFQSLWCLVFRLKFINTLWLSACQLLFAAVSMLLCHNELTKVIDMNNSFHQKLVLLALRFPISLHSTWLVAASLVNFNSWIAFQKTALSSQVSWAYASLYVAVMAGVVITILNADPFIALTLSWALLGISCETKLSKVEVPEIVKLSLSSSEKVLSQLMGIVALALPALFGLKGKLF